MWLQTAWSRPQKLRLIILSEVTDKRCLGSPDSWVAGQELAIDWLSALKLQLASLLGIRQIGPFIRLLPDHLAHCFLRNLSKTITSDVDKSNAASFGGLVFMLFLFSFTCTHLQFQVSLTNSPPRSLEARMKLSAVHVGIEADTALSACPLPGRMCGTDVWYC